MSKGLSTCPFCGIQSGNHISDGLYKCGGCLIVYNSDSRSLSYDRDYFISEYRSQYGKTYLDDFDNIYTLSNSRLDKIIKFLKIPLQNASVLDIGSAAGFFLKAAADRGAGRVTGIEISEYASDHCRKSYGIEVVNSPFESADLDGRFDIITSWYFIEHLSDPLSALNRIFGMLNDGGIFAAGIPSYFGPMFCFDRDQWISTHPKDHRIDLSPAGAGKILKRIGFRKVYVVRSGYHPERIISRTNILFRPFELFYRFFTSITAFSDTIEIYAVK